MSSHFTASNPYSLYLITTDFAVPFFCDFIGFSFNFHGFKFRSRKLIEVHFKPPSFTFGRGILVPIFNFCGSYLK